MERYDSKVKLTVIILSFGLIFLGDVQAQGKPKRENIVSLKRDKSKLLPKYAPGEVLIGLKEGFEDADVDALAQQVNIVPKGSVGVKAKISERIHNIKSAVESTKKVKVSLKGLSDEQVFKESYKMMPAYEKKLYRSHKIKLPAEVSVEEAIAKLRTNPAIEYAEPNYLLELYSIPNDPYYSSTGSWGQTYDDLWGIKKLQCANAWDLAQGEGVVVAVIDSGVDYSHEDLASNIWMNTKEIPNNGIDDDGNGYIDDARGWDFSGNGNNVVEDNDPIDYDGHGTHVSGTIAAIGNNGIGVIGVAPKAKIMPVKLFPNAYDSVAVKCIKYAVDNGAKVLSNSWGGGASSQTIRDAFDYAHNKGVVSVVAAGNSNEDASFSEPARYQSVITVAASDQNDNRCYFSNYGAKIDVAAPGGNGSPDPYNILSLLASTHDPYYNSHIVGSSYLRIAGTSMSTPHVSGLAALILSKNPTLKNEEVRQIIRQSADDIDAAGWDLNTGYGRVNAYKALDMLNKNIMPPIAHIAGYTRDVNAKTLTIKGSASANGFSSYVVEYGIGAVPTTWTTLKTSTTQVVDGDLATLNTAAFQEGYYSIKLSVSSLSGASVDRLYLYFSPNFVLLWQTQGNSVFPVNIAVDEKNKFVYVANYLDNIIQKFDTDGRFLKQWIVSAPIGIRVDKDGYIWMLDGIASDPVVNKYDPEGNWITGFGSYGTGIDNISFPTDIDIDNDGNIYVCNSDTARGINRIMKFDGNGVFIQNIGSSGSGDGQFNSPLGIAIDGNYLYVTDSGDPANSSIVNNRVQKFKTDGTFVSKWGSYGTGNGQFDYLSYIAADGHGRIYVADSGNSRIQVFDTDGNFLSKFGSQGVDEGQFKGWMPYEGSTNFVAWNGLSADKNMPNRYIYLVDMLNLRIEKFKAFNRMPVMNPIGNKTVKQGQLLKFEVGVSDPDNDVLAFTVNNLPVGAQFVTVAGEVPSQAQIPGLYGDVNLDGSITNDDATVLSNYVAGLTVLTDIQKITAEVIGDGTVDLKDLLMLRQYLSGTRNSFSVIVRYADVNLDGKITNDDATVLSNYLAGLTTLTEIQKIAADITGDGKVDLKDLLMIRQYLAGTRNYFTTTTKRFFIWKPTSTQVKTYTNVIFKVTDGKEIINGNIVITVTK